MPPTPRPDIPFNRPHFVGTETEYIEAAVRTGWISAGGTFGARCERHLADRLGAARVLLTHSCTAALEASAILLGLGPGDEVIVPSFTFVSVANAYVLRGATPVFVDVRADTFNLDPEAAAAAITPRTKAIVPVHYAGVGADVAALAQTGIPIVEDAAHGIGATDGGRPLGTVGRLSTLSFHETKNVTCGEGGALVVNDPELVAPAEVVWHKGTDRSRFDRGQVDKYTWRGLGSSYGLGEVSAAFLWAQLERVEQITAARRAIWDRYHAAFEPLERSGRVRRPVIPPGCEHNAHMYHLLVEHRAAFIDSLAARGVSAVFHYVPLHSSPAGRRIGRVHGSMSVTDTVSEQLVRLPLWVGMSGAEVDRVIDAVSDAARG